MSKNTYETPLSSRYASKRMRELFSPDTRYRTWRRLWVALARSERELGLPITEAQVAELEAHVDDEIDYESVARREAQLRHDVMAHIHEYGESCPGARGIIHLGATSCYVTDNADIIIYRDALKLIRGELTRAIASLSQFALKYKDMPTLGYTHYQPAQLVTVGKRACLWIQDMLLDLDELDFCITNLKFHGCRGTTGTEASFLSLFDGDHDKTRRVSELIAREFGFEGIFAVAGQTYPRKYDSRILNVLSSIAQSAYRFAGDIRLLQHDRQLQEPFESSQVGSSAMAYKRNPMRCERICSLARYVVIDALNAPMTACTQWLERTLDDSANRRISIPEAFLAVDSILRLVNNVASGICVNEGVIARTVAEYLPFIATENLLMSAVKMGGDRQAVHEIIRECSMAATERINAGEPCDLLSRLAEHEGFPMDETELLSQLDPADYIGRCPQQVEEFIGSIALEHVEAEHNDEINV
ncbi:MAG: adenylosuccinate lyase [Clostridia bacterium]|nr:adenylosuccinate lyase [Clostridia bacterium]